MFYGGSKYRHRNFLDVDMYVQRRQYSGPTYWKLKVIWYSQRGHSLGFTETVTVKRKDWSNWKLVP